MKIVFLDTATLGEDVSLAPFKTLGELETHSVTEDSQIVERSFDADVLVVNKVRIEKRHLQRLLKLKLICLAATGMDNIDLVACQERGVAVKNAKGYSTDSVAQTALAMVLSLQCRLPEQDEFGKSHWVNDTVFTNLNSPFRELRGKTWGIIGLGDIGSKCAEVASALGCEVVYYSTTGSERSKVYRRASLEEVLGSHVVGVHCPLTEKTRHLINKNNVSFLRNDAVLVNVARGGVMDERAVVDRFKSTKLRLGVDVASVEPVRKDNPLLEIADSKRFTLTPHMAWSALEARTRLMEIVLQNIKDWIREV